MIFDDADELSGKSGSGQRNAEYSGRIGGGVREEEVNSI